MNFTPVGCSLADLVGKDYLEAVCRARAALTGIETADLLRSACEPVEFWPESFQRRVHELLPLAGRSVSPSWMDGPAGAGPRGFCQAAKTGAAPLTGLGYFRVGQDGRLYVVSKSEHYHASLGHAFPGFALVERARALGIPNATHNNTRGPITRRLEEDLVRAVAGLSPADDLDAVLRSREPGVLNRVLNLQTGSLAVEAALKLALCRFYRHEAGGPEPAYRNRTPVVLVIGDDAGGLAGNYHGTTVLTQLLRGLWPEMRLQSAASGPLEVRAVQPNSIADLEEAFQRFEKRPYKIAALVH